MAMMNSVIFPMRQRAALIRLKKLKKHCTPTGQKQKRFWNRLKKQGATLQRNLTTGY